MTRHPLVLIADDDAYIRDVLVSMIGYILPDARITAVENGREGLDCYRKNGADLVISNFLMPEMDGPSFVAKVRKSNATVPIIMVSGSPEAEKLGMEAGIDRFIDKFDLRKRLPEEVHSLMTEEHVSSHHSATY